MTTADDQVFAELLGLIRQHGWAVRHVGPGPEPGDSAFSYTVGLTALRHPEVVVTGLPFEHAQVFLNNIGDDVRGGLRYQAGDITENLTGPGAAVVFLAVDDVSGLTAVQRVYDRVEAVQMVWPDSTGQLPWQDGYRNAPGAQPLLGQRPLLRSAVPRVLG